MLYGIAILKWDKKYGLKIEEKYPETIEIDETIIKQVYTNHEFEEEAGFLSISIQELNIASFYTGSPVDLYLIAILSLDEIPEDYEEILSNTMRLIISNLRGRKYIEELPIYFNNIGAFPKMTKEQRLALILLDPLKKIVLDRLIEDGMVSKSELNSWLKDRFGTENVNLDPIINSLLRNKILHEETIENMTSSSIFLVGDIFVSRIPPKSSLMFVKGMVSLDPKITKNYSNDIQMFFQKYNPDPQDQELILRILTDMDCYNIISRLRTAPLIQDSIAYKNLEGKMKDFNEILKKLWEAQIISVIKNKNGIEHLFLRTDIAVRHIFPLYLLNKIRALYHEGSKSENIITRYLRILQDRFYDHKKESK
ncbi:MAG: hypothetical protein EAX96_10470 [Candidatus Lokiarchaeota archaeon]|nr:hypothetical protein [Candidatus Lokiarchaeota archaeon]